MVCTVLSVENSKAVLYSKTNMLPLRLIPAKRQHAASANWLVALIVAISALAPTSHLDMPVPEGGELASLEASPVAYAASTHTHTEDGDTVIDRCDHCCHASAHLVGLIAATPATEFTLPSDLFHTMSQALSEAKTDPPYIPPIA